MSAGSVDAAQPGHARREGTHARHHETVRGLRRGMVGGERHVRAGALEGAYRRPQVARPVVEDDYLSSGASHRDRGPRGVVRRRSEAGEAKNVVG